MVLAGRCGKLFTDPRPISTFLLSIQIEPEPSSNIFNKPPNKSIMCLLPTETAGSLLEGGGCTSHLPKFLCSNRRHFHVGNNMQPGCRWPYIALTYICSRDILDSLVRQETTAKAQFPSMHLCRKSYMCAIIVLATYKLHATL